MGFNLLIQNIAIHVKDKNKNIMKLMKPIEDSRIEILKEIFAIWNDVLTHINKKHTKEN